MSLVNRTFALPLQTWEFFKKEVPPGERSALVASLLREWLDERRRRQLQAEIREGCAAMAELYLEIEKEYHPLEEEVHRVLEGKPKARRRGAGPT